MAGLYIHIPFCESRCIYCGFYSTTSLKLRNAYIDALGKEMELRPLASEIGEGEHIKTIYLGGGTPSMLSGKQIVRLFESIKNYLVREEQRGKNEELNGWDIFDGMEITMECNPDDVTEDFCETLQQLPVNRISMGAQTFSNERLHFLHRRHHAEDVKVAVQRLRNIGIHNISIDLMFGFPGETLDEWKDDIQEAIHQNVEHISAYSLMYEEGTTLYRLLDQGKITEIDEETSRQMYETLISTLTLAGYEHYEISNFARPGYRSRHNSSYWNEIPYVGLGAAAHSYKRIKTDEVFTDDEGEESIKAIRSWNVDNIQEYIKKIDQGIRPSEGETLDLRTRYNDLITTALRTSDGISIKHMQQEFGSTLTLRLKVEAQKHIDRGLMKIRDGRLSLTRKGLYISDDVMSDFMIV